MRPPNGRDIPLPDPALLDWDTLSPEGQKRLSDQYRGFAEPGQIDWNWDAVPFNRVALMARLAAHRPEASYLEIGCDRDVLFRALPLTDKTGVDPVRGGTHRMTSDAFFAQNDRTFDLVFVDGLHRYDQVRRDVEHALAALRLGGWIGIHDMLPSNWRQAFEIRTCGAWVGDVWKLGFDLAETEGLDFRIVTIDYGVGLLRKTGDGTVRLPAVTEARRRAGFARFLADHDRLPLIDWQEACAWIDGSKALSDP